MFKITLKKCSLCNKTIWINRLGKLKKNHHDFGKKDEISKDVTSLCKPCYDKHEYVKCTYTGKVFLGKGPDFGRIANTLLEEIIPISSRN